MLIATLQALLTTAACFGLWRFVNALGGRGLTSRIIVAGFLLRALGGQLLFWISWLRLPVGRSLQLGNGFWFFALDGQAYLAFAGELLSKGVKAVLFADALYPSHIFVQCLTLFTAAFGVVASTAILLNCAAYVATCALIVRIAPPAAERARNFTLAAVAFGPATFLWSLQPLKDTFFLLLITAMIALGHEWQNLWRNANDVRRSIACAAAMCVTIYAIAGTRWYVGAVIAVASVVFLPLVANLPRPRLAATLVAIALVVALGEAFLIGGDSDVPTAVRQMFDPTEVFRGRVEKTADLLATARRGFDTTHGKTSILPGAALQPPPVRPKETSTPKRAAPPPATETIATPVDLPKPPPSVPTAATPTESAPQPVVAVATPPQRQPEIVAPPVVAEKREPIAPPPVETTPPPAAAPSVVVTAPPPVPTESTPPQSPAPVAVDTRAPEASPIPPPAVATTAPATPVRTRTAHHASPKTIAPAVAAVTPLPRNAIVVVVRPKPVPAAPVTLSLAAKITSGLAAMFLPRAIAQRAGLVQIGGGRGFWLFADADTLVFDLVILTAFGYCAHRLARDRRRATPLFILVALIFFAICGPLTYAVTNFGTLFRLRQMLYVLAALLPITLARPERAR